MKLEIKHPKKQFQFGLFSSGVVCDGWLYISGQGPLDMADGKAISGSIEEETKITLCHIESILREAGCGLENVVKCTCYLADLKDFEGFNRTYGSFFSGIRPARTTIQAVLMKGIKIEIDAVARLPETPQVR